MPWSSALSTPSAHPLVAGEQIGGHGDGLRMRDGRPTSRAPTPDRGSRRRGSPAAACLRSPEISTVTSQPAITRSTSQPPANLHHFGDARRDDVEPVPHVGFPFRRRFRVAGVAGRSPGERLAVLLEHLGQGNRRIEQPCGLHSIDEGEDLHGLDGRVEVCAVAPGALTALDQVGDDVDRRRAAACAAGRAAGRRARCSRPAAP